MQITVNGQAVDFDGDTINYEDVLFIAKERMGASCTYSGPRHGDSQRSGTLATGDKPIALEPGMRFNCIMTGNG